MNVVRRAVSLGQDFTEIHAPDATRMAPDPMWHGLALSGEPSPNRRTRRRAGTERLSLMQAHRADVAAKIVELQGDLRLIDRKIDVYQGRRAAGDADRFWAPHRRPNAQ